MCGITGGSVPGEDFGAAIAAELEKADLILLLVSPDFLASDYCYEREMARAMERHAAGAAKVLPVILRPCDWHEAPFGRLLATPTDGKPITKFADLDDAFLEVTKAIKAAAASLSRPSPGRAPAVATGTGSSATAAPAVPRSGNMRLTKHFTDADKDRFLDHAFEFMALYFENSLAELEKRNPDIETTFKRIDAHQFTAAVYREGTARARCRIFMLRSFSSGIAYSATIAAWATATTSRSGCMRTKRAYFCNRSVWQCIGAAAAGKSGGLRKAPLNFIGRCLSSRCKVDLADRAGLRRWLLIVEGGRSARTHSVRRLEGIETGDLPLNPGARAWVEIPVGHPFDFPAEDSGIDLNGSIFERFAAKAGDSLARRPAPRYLIFV